MMIVNKTIVQEIKYLSNILTVDGIAITTPILDILKKLQSTLLNGKLKVVEDKQ